MWRVRHRLPPPLFWRVAIACWLAVAMAAAYLFWRDAPLPGAIEGQTLTWRFQTRGPVAPPPEIAIVAIDDATMSTLKRWPVPRQVLADAISRLNDAGARVVGLDLLLLDPSSVPGGAAPSAGDVSLGAALQTMPSVLPLAFTFERDSEMDLETVRVVREAALPLVHHSAGISSPDLAATGALLPLELFRAGASLGHVNVLADDDGVLRQIHAAVAVGGRYIPAFPVEVARHFRRLSKQQVILLLGRSLVLDGISIPTDHRERLPLYYYGPPKTVPTYALSDLLANRIPQNQLADRAVLIGASAVGAGDTFVTPFSRSLPGVEVLATMTANLIAGQVLDRGAAVARWDLAVIVGFGLAAFAAGRLLSPAAATGATMLLLATLVAIVHGAFLYGLTWLNLTFPVAAVLLNGSIAAADRTMLERRARRDAERQKANLSRYHSPMIADLLAQEMPDAAERRQMAAIMFVDLAGFTARCERLAPEAAARFLRQFHGHIERAVLAHGGMLDQFLGDGAMVIFGVRHATPADPVAALGCARRLLEDIAVWSGQLAAEGGEPLVIRIGIHYGPVVISRLGGPRHMHFSAAGDTVNVAARLEGLSRASGSTITISGSMVTAIREAGRQDLLAGFLELPPQPIRGREGRLTVWTLHHQPAAASEKM